MGEHLKYLVWAQGRPIACLAWSSAPRHLGSRDRYIGWSAEARRRNIRFIAYNTRFLILPWVRRASSGVAHSRPDGSACSPTTGSGCTGIRFISWKPSSIPGDFAEPVTARPTGYCWDTPPGAGKNDQTNKPNRPIKEVLGYPLTPRFRELPQPDMNDPRRRIEVNLEELDQIIDAARARR